MIVQHILIFVICLLLLRIISTIIVYLFHIYVNEVTTELQKFIFKCAKTSHLYRFIPFCEMESYHRYNPLRSFQLLNKIFFKTPLSIVYMLRIMHYIIDDGDTSVVLLLNAHINRIDSVSRWVKILRNSKPNKRIKHIVKIAASVNTCYAYSNGFDDFAYNYRQFNLEHKQIKRKTLILRINIILDFISWLFENFYILLLRIFKNRKKSLYKK